MEKSASVVDRLSAYKLLLLLNLTVLLLMLLEEWQWLDGLVRMHVFGAGGGGLAAVAHAEVASCASASARAGARWSGQALRLLA